MKLTAVQITQTRDKELIAERTECDLFWTDLLPQFVKTSRDRGFIRVRTPSLTQRERIVLKPTLIRSSTKY